MELELEAEAFEYFGELDHEAWRRGEGDYRGYEAFEEPEAAPHTPSRTNRQRSRREKEARRTFASLQSAGARLLVTGNEGHSGEDALVIVPPAFDGSTPFDVRVHYHGMDATASRPADDAQLPSRIASQLRRAPPTVFVFPFARMVLTDSRRTWPDWRAAKDSRLTALSAVAAAGLQARPGRVIVSGHSAGGQALSILAKRGGLSCDLLILEDCLYRTVKQDVIEWARTPQGRACPTVISFRGTNQPWISASDLPNQKLIRVCGSSHYEHVLFDPESATSAVCAPKPHKTRLRPELEFSGFEDGAFEFEDFEDDELQDEVGHPRLFAGFSESEKKAIAFTSKLETGTAFGLGGATGNFDGYGVSFGLMQWNIGAGSLQPQLLAFLKAEPSRFKAVFGSAADAFAAQLNRGRGAVKEQLAWVIETMNGGGKQLTPEWRSRWNALAAEPGFQRLEVEQIKVNLRRAVAACRQLGLTSERALVLAFDATAWPGPYWYGKKAHFRRQKNGPSILEEINRRIAGAGGAQVPEKARLLIMANVFGDHASAKWAPLARNRKVAIVTDGRHREVDVRALHLSDGPFTTSLPSAVPGPSATGPSATQVPKAAGSASADAVRARAAQWAVKQAADPHVGYSQKNRMGNRVDAKGFRYFDCSGLVYMAYLEVGVKLGATTTATMFETWRRWANEVPNRVGALKPGDLILVPGHVVMYTGNGRCVGAQTSKTKEFADQVRANIDATKYLTRKGAIVLRPHV